MTDVRLIRKADGTSRRVAFLGFKHERDAQTARDYFDKTYLDISKLSVDIVMVCTLNYFFLWFPSRLIVVTTSPAVTGHQGCTFGIAK